MSSTPLYKAFKARRLATEEQQERKDRSDLHKLRVLFKGFYRFQLREQGLTEAEITQRIRKVGKQLKPLQWNDAFERARYYLRGTHWKEFLERLAAKNPASSGSESGSEGPEPARGSRD